MIELKNQIHFSDIYEEVVDYFQEDKPLFIKLFQKNIDMKVKWLCTKAKKIRIKGKPKYILTCENPCIFSPCVRIYLPTIIKDYRLNCPISRNSEERICLYKIRAGTERTNNLLKNLPSLSTIKINKTSALKTESILAGITQLISLIISHKINNKKTLLYIKSLLLKLIF